MPVNWQLVEMPLGGMDQYTDAPHVLPGQVHQAVNARFAAPPKLSKRNGREELTAATKTTTRLQRWGRELLNFADNELYTYDNVHDSMRSAGLLSVAHADARDIHIDAERSIDKADCASNGTHTVYAYITSEGTSTVSYAVQIVVIDNETGGVVYYTGHTSGASTSPTRVRVIYAGTQFYVFWMQPGVTNEIQFRKWDSATSSISFSTAAQVALNNTPDDADRFDAAPYGSGYLITFSTDTVRELNVDRFNSADALQASYSPSNVVAGCMSVEGDAVAQTIVVAWEQSSGTPGLYVATLSEAMSATAGPNAVTTTDLAVDVGLGRASSTHTWIVWRVAAESSGTAPVRRAHTRYARLVISSATVSGNSFIRDVIPSSKPFLHEGRMHVAVAYQDEKYDKTDFTDGEILTGQSEQPTYYLAQIADDDGTVIGGRWVGTALRAQGLPGYLTNATEWSTGKWVHAAHRRIRVRFAGVADAPVITDQEGAAMLTWDLNTGRRYDVARWGRSLAIAGARPGLYDGLATTEMGYAWYPENLHVNGNNTGGQLGDGTYQVCFVYEWYDSQGNLHQSAPSEIFTVTLSLGTNAQRLTCLICEELWTSELPVYLVAYRTEANGTVFYRAEAVIKEYGQTISIGGSINDAELVLRELLYTTGDILDNQGPPPCKGIVYHNDRLWLVATDDAEWLWFSQPWREGDAPRFNEGLRVNIGDKVTAARSMDGELIVFTETAIYVVAGQGPPATGGLDIGFVTALVATDTGCSEPRSILVTPLGIVFQGDKGIYLLTRGRQLEFIGAEIERRLALYPTVVDASLQREATEVLITCAGDPDLGEAGGRIFVWDYAQKMEGAGRGQWLEDSIPSSEVCGAACVAWSGTDDEYRHVYATTTNTIRRETETVKTDGTSFAPWSMISPWLPINTKQGWQLVRRFLFLFEKVTNVNGSAGDDFGLRFQFAYNYNSNSFTETHSYSIAAVTALIPEGQVEVPLARHQCQAVRVKITETTAPQPAELYNSTGPNARSLVWQVGVKPRHAKLPDTARK